MRKAILIAVVMCLSGCGEDVVVDEKRPDYWLEQRSSFSGEWDRVARVFGFYEDREGCESIVKALAQELPKAQYRCVRAVGPTWWDPDTMGH